MKALSVAEMTAAVKNGKGKMHAIAGLTDRADQGCGHLLPLAEVSGTIRTEMHDKARPWGESTIDPPGTASPEC